MARSRLPTTARDRAAAALLMLAATAAFTVMTALVKDLCAHGAGTAEVMVYRTALGLPWLVWLARRAGAPLWPRRPPLVLLRSVFGAAAMATGFYAVTALSLTQYTVITLLQPVLVAVLAPAVLAERLGLRTVVALVFALAGAAVVVHPGRDVADVALLPAAIATASALFSAAAHLTVRRAAATDRAETVVIWFAFFIAVCGLPWAIASGGFRGLPEGLPAARAVLEIAAMAGCGAAGQLLMTRAYERAAAAEVAIVGYAAIPGSVVADLVAFGVAVPPATFAGAALMIVAGVVLIGR